jgi:hypothetical protein
MGDEEKNVHSLLKKGLRASPFLTGFTSTSPYKTVALEFPDVKPPYPTRSKKPK